ncbi:hypothetical protein [Streptomyces exfoliatus]|uniref:hypothetical protein n=1 Tax=Streptomyces exfoliatus TaxID=1905 RepID=UPI003C2E0CB7
MTADQAVKLLSRMPAPTTCTEPVTPQVTPSAPTPAVGQPTTPPADRHPDKDPGEETSNLPDETTETADVAAAIDEPSSLEDARALIGVLHLLSPALRHIPPGMRDELARLAARWLDAGHTSTDVHQHILRGLPGAGTPVHRPGGLIRYLLRDVPPLTLPPQPAPQLSARLQGARECTGHHTQPMLFRPLTDETLCPACVTPGREPVHAPS